MTTRATEVGFCNTPAGTCCAGQFGEAQELEQENATLKRILSP